MSQQPIKLGTGDGFNIHFVATFFCTACWLVLAMISPNVVGYRWILAQGSGFCKGTTFVKGTQTSALDFGQLTFKPAPAPSISKFPPHSGQFKVMSVIV